jgi:hypothetical protein
METQSPGVGIVSIYDDSHQLVIHLHAGDADGPVTRELWIGTESVGNISTPRQQVRRPWLPAP